MKTFLCGLCITMLVLLFLKAIDNNQPQSQPQKTFYEDFDEMLNDCKGYAVVFRTYTKGLAEVHYLSVIDSTKTVRTCCVEFEAKKGDTLIVK